MLKAKNPQYVNLEETIIDLEYNHPSYGWIPFSASADDVESIGKELFAGAKAGDFGKIKKNVNVIKKNDLEYAKTIQKQELLAAQLILDAEEKLQEKFKKIDMAKTITTVKKIK